MALINYTLPFGNVGPAGMNWGTIATGLQTPRADAVNGLLYDPADHQPEQSQQITNNAYYRNDPYAPPAYQRSQYNGQSNHYLPPRPTTRPTFSRTQNGNKNTGSSTGFHEQVPPTRSYNEGSYSRPVQENDGRSSFFEQVNYRTDSEPASFSQARTTPSKPTPSRTTNRGRVSTTVDNNNNNPDAIPNRPGGYVKVQSGQGKKTQTVAVLDYDDDDESEDDDYFDAENGSLKIGQFTHSFTALCLTKN